MNRAILAVALSTSVIFTAGCATKKYVRNQTAPIINQTNELDDLTAKNTRDIKDVDERAQKGITDVNSKISEVETKTQNANTLATQANTLATSTNNNVLSLANTVANLDSYHPVVDTSVHFGFDKADLTKKAKAALDELGTEIPNQKHYIVVVEGGADAVGGKDYNYGLSQRRADAVIQYLASKYNVPAHKIFLVGLGKDKPVAPNSSAAGRAKNRRVDIHLMTNEVASSQTAANSSNPQ